MSSNSGKGINGILPQNLFQTVTNFFSSFKPFDFLMHRGKNNIPYGFMSIATIAIGSVTYVTYKDYSNEISAGISDTIDSIQSSEMFIPSVDSNNENNIFDTNSSEEPIINQELDINIGEPSPTAPPVEDESKPTAPPIEEEEEEPKPTAPPIEEKKEVEPGEKYKMGGMSKKRRKRKNKSNKTKRTKRQKDKK